MRRGCALRQEPGNHNAAARKSPEIARGKILGQNLISLVQCTATTLVKRDLHRLESLERPDPVVQ